MGKIKGLTFDRNIYDPDLRNLMSCSRDVSIYVMQYVAFCLCSPQDTFSFSFSTTAPS